MVRRTNAVLFSDGNATYFEFAGTSTDTKPEAGVATGSLFVETDTHDVYIFNEEGSTDEKWTLFVSMGGGS